MTKWELVQVNRKKPTTLVFGRANEFFLNQSLEINCKGKPKKVSATSKEEKLKLKCTGSSLTNPGRGRKDILPINEL